MKKVAGVLLACLAVMILVTGVLLEYAALRLGGELGDARLWVGSAGLVMMGGGGWLFKTARQLGAISGDAILARDGRPIVTYLRSFQADRGADVASNERMAARLAGLVTPALIHSFKTEEEEIALALAPVGPLLAIGRPGEILPQLGAHRVYADDDSWQNKVAELLDRSALVLMRAGETEGFWWEVAYVRDRFSPEHVVVLLPKKREDYEAFRTRTERYLPHPLPDFDPVDGDASYGGLLWFERDWTPHVERVRANLNVARHGIAADLTRMLRPVLARLAILPPLRAHWKLRVKAAALDLALITVPIILGAVVMPALGSETLAFAALIVAFGVMIAVAILDLVPNVGSPGKLLTGIRIRDAAGFPPRFPQLLIRQLVRVFGVSFFYSYISIPLVVSGRRAIHDAAVGTDVMDVRPDRGEISLPPAANLVPG